jgi:hypothetical protein
MVPELTEDQLTLSDFAPTEPGNFFPQFLGTKPLLRVSEADA